MKSTFAVIILAVMLADIVGGSFHKTGSTDRILKEMRYELEMEDAVKSLSRARRVPVSSDVRACGRKLILFVLTVCQQSCDPGRGREVASKCCSEECSSEYIKEECCPDS